MANYALAQRTTSGTAATPSWEIIAAAANRPKVKEIGISQVAATAGVYGLGRPAAKGVTPTSPQTFLAEDAGGATGNTTAAVAWATPPTVPANFFRRVACAATIGVGVIWTFPEGLTIPASTGSLVIWVIATAPVCDVWAVVDE